MKTAVCFIVGPGGVGKDEFIKNLEKYSKVTNISSINCVRDLLGISLEDKRPETRNVLATVGEALEIYNGFRTNAVFDDIHFRFALDESNRKAKGIHFIFVHVREKYIIDKLVARLKRELPPVLTYNIFVWRPHNVNDYSNTSDLEASADSSAKFFLAQKEVGGTFLVHRIKHTNDLVIDNSRDLEALDLAAKKFEYTILATL